ncbi:MAG: NADH-quinone oxidoreductase subunit N [Arenicellaceae bacterium]|nr:NADH-quinone oxidoreductase subunit N [Arenicellaceae bacterium]
METGIQALLAPLVVSIVALILMMQIAFKRHAIVSWLLGCTGFILAILALKPMADIVPKMVTPLLLSDQYSLFFSALILFSGLITTLLAKDYLQNRRGENEEFYLLLLLSSLGAMILVSATHVASFLLGMELLGVALYALIAYPERGQLPLEAAIKYLILSGAASAILLFGFALIYAVLGTLSFVGIGQALTQPILEDQQLLILLGTAMVFTGIGFKLSLVPFHMWTPDVYQGAPVPVTGFLATVSKGAIFAALLRLFIDAELYQYQGLMLSLSVLAIASMLAGNLLALKQDNLKRILAYSSIAHIGYLFITLIVYGVLQQPGLAVEAATFYLSAYIITSLAAFSLLSIISSNISETDLDDISHIQGLFWRQPMLALMLTIALLSLAGIPLTVGFIGKFYIFTAGIEGSLWVLLAALIIGSGISIYYYLRIVFQMTMKEPAGGSGAANMDPNSVRLSVLSKFVVWLLIFMMLYLGVLPQTLMEYLGGLSL